MRLHDGDCPMTNAREEDRTSCTCDLAQDPSQPRRYLEGGGGVEMRKPFDTVEEAEAVCRAINWTSLLQLAEREVDAIVYVTTSYMVGDISRERAAAALGRTPESMPDPWPGGVAP